MTREEIIEKARERLPYASEVKARFCHIPVAKEDVISFDMFILSSETKIYWEVVFVKQEISGVLVGWEFHELID